VSLRGREALGLLAHTFGESLDGRSGAFEQLVHVVTVIAAEPFSDVGVPQLTGRHIHGKPWYRDTRPKCATPADPGFIQGGDDALDDEEHEEDDRSEERRVGKEANERR